MANETTQEAKEQLKREKEKPAAFGAAVLQEWEYQILNVNLGFNSSPSAQLEKINAAGRDGWEAFATSQGSGSQQIFVFCKRPK